MTLAFNHSMSGLLLTFHANPRRLRGVQHEGSRLGEGWGESCGESFGESFGESASLGRTTQETTQQHRPRVGRWEVLK